ncbi:MAG: hypothetical protein H6696_05375 [Deferribacteres bacterium]|nr:hypothetical protein [candidate division KSB1 bacterium]MCB9501348.1 hypothetical protein [Deferribacteres bacterium]
MELWFTYGPKTDSLTNIKNAFLNGANGYRLTFSFSTHSQQESRAKKIRNLE